MGEAAERRDGAGWLDARPGLCTRPVFTGAVGLGQITKTAITDLEGGDTGKADLPWRQLQTDQDLNASLSARYYSLMRQRFGSDHEALRHYHGLKIDKNRIGPDQYAANVEAREGAFQNDTHRLDNVSSVQSDLAAQKGRVD